MQSLFDTLPDITPPVNDSLAFEQSMTERNNDNYQALSSDIENMLREAQPRLLRFARKQGVTPDAIDDVVQETLIVAWRNLNQLRSSERFDAWLSGICRHICQRWQQAHYKLGQRQESFSHFYSQEGEEAENYQNLTEKVFSTLILDPIEELSHQELAILLDHAMAYLPHNARSALELYYLGDLSQREAAQHLGLSLNALEVRLHRARHQLRQVLCQQMRTEAEDFGLLLPQEQAETTGWRETRLWCMFCGQDHLQGRFETLPDGRVNLHMRCPTCLPSCGGDWINSGGMYELVGLRSFRPAFNRLQQAVSNYWTSVENMQFCLYCQARVQVKLLGPDEMHPNISARWHGFRFVMQCAACGSLASSYVGSSLWLQPAAMRFMQQHPRWILEPETLITFDNQPAIRVSLADITSTARLTTILHRETLQTLATFP